MSGTTEPKTPDENGWMTIHGGESITVKLPEGVTYTVEEQTTSGTVTGTVHTDLTYTPRYDSNRSGTTGTVDTAATTIRNAVHKSLSLVKQNESGAALAGAEFTVSYVPLEDSPYAGTAGTKTFTTNTAGQLLGEDGKPIDLTSQGTYILKEIKAPAGYITPTDNNGNPIVLATITVDANDEMSVKSNSPLVTVVLDAYASQASVTVKNEQTRARIGKTIDYANGTALKGAKLEIYGSDHKKVLEWTTGSVPRLIGDGTLKEGVVYRLHEVENSAPVGYLEAGDVYFKLNGTYTDTDGNRYSRIVITDEEGNTTDAAGRAISQNTDGSVYGDPGVVGGVLNMVDKSIRVPVTLKKVLEYSPLSDVIFTVTNDDTTPGTVIGTAKTGTDGFLVWEKTENGHNAGEEIVLQQNTNGYTFTETYAPDHAYNDGRMFTVNPTDHNFIDYLDKRDLALNVRTNAMETKDAGFAADTGTVINLPYKSTVTLYKYDKEEAADSAAISGAEFTLYHATVNESGEWTKGEPVDDAYETGQTSPNATGVFTTNASGNLSIEIHNKGYYILEETAAVSGYKLDTKNPPRFPFTLIDGTSDDVAAKKEFCYDGTAVLKAEGDAKGVPNEKIHLSLFKVDYKNHDSKLAGVTFTLEPANGSSFINSYVTNHPGEFSNGKITLTTDENGKISIPPGLVQQNHSYILTETDLGGNTSYRLADSETDRQITFLVNEDGTMTITSPNAMFGLAEGNETALVVKNQQVSLTVAKRDQATGEPVEGVTLQLSKEVSENNWSPVALDGVTGANGQWVTDAAGTVTFQGTVFTPGTYRLEEISAPDGYNTVADSLTFAIDQSGKVATAKVGENDWTDLTKSNRNFTITNPTDGQPGGITLDVANAAYSDLKITKTGSDGALLGGVEFRLDYLDGTNRTVPATTSNEEGANKGIATFSGLPNGKYRLTELNTAQGYNLLSAPLEIEIDRNSETYTVASNGTVISGENGLTRDGDTILLPVINQKGLVLPATGTTTPQLPRAVLGLTALLEGLVLYLYQMQGKRRKKETRGKK